MRLFMRTVSLVIVGCAVFQSCEAPISFSLKSTVNSITLTWTPEDGHGYSDFIITLDGTQRGGLHPGSEFDTGSSKTDEMITGLDSGTQYNVAVMSGTDEIWSGSIYTIPAQVTTFTRTSSTLNTVTLSWTHGSGERESYTIRWGVSEKEENVPSTDTSITITGLTPGQTYTFSIVAVSKNKDSAAVTEVVTLTALPTVENFAVSSVTEHSVTLTWTAVDTDENIKYELSYESTTATREKDITTHSFSGLSAGTQYTFSILVVLDGVKGSQEIITDNTQPATPVGVTVEPESTTEVKVGWTANSIYTYTVTYKKKESTGDPIPTSCVTTGCVIDVSAAKPPGTEITVYVTATLGTRTSNTGTAEGHTVPPAPGQISISTRTTTTLEVTWLDGAAGVFDKYEVSIIDTSTGNAPDGLGTMEIDDEAMKTASLSPLIPGRVYSVNVVTVKGTTPSEQSTGLFRPNPEKASGLKMDSRSTNSLTVKWNQPGEGDFTKYVVSLSGKSGSEEKVSSKTHTFTDLIGGTQYTASIRVQSGEDDDTATETTAAKTTSEEVTLDMYTKPNAPTLNAPSATQVSVTVSWTAPAGDLTGYKLRLYSSDNSPVSEEKTVLKDGEKTLIFDSADSVESGTIYTVKIFAYIDDSGNEIRSNETSKQATTVPRAPTGFKKANTDTSSTQISWSMPGQTGVDGYEVKLDFNGDVKAADVTSTSKDFTGLKAGATYSIEIKAYKLDHNNERSYSPALTDSVTLKPKKPTSVKVLAENKEATRLGVTWSAPSDSEYSSFIVYWRKTGTSDTLEFSGEIPRAQTYKYDISDLDIGGTYHIEVKTKSGDQLSEAEITTSSTSLPTVDNFGVSSVTETSVTLNWTAVDTDENIKYELSYESTTATREKDITTHLFTGLSAGTQYNFSILVVLDGVKGSQEIITDNTQPATPVGVTVEPESTTEVKVGWTANSKYTYTVTYKKKESTGDPITTSCVTTGCVIDVSAVGIPGTEITVYVTATLGTRTSNTGTAEGHTVPSAPGQISVSARTATTLEVTWLDEAAGVFDKYRVSVIDISTSSAPDGLGTMEIDNEAVKTASLSPLIPGRVYRVNVVTVKGTTPSEPATGLFRPNPEEATGLELDNRTTNSLTVKWNQPEEGDFTKYVVSLSGISESEEKVSSRTHTFTELIGGTQYTASVRVQSGEDDDTATATTAAKTTSEEVTLHVYTKPNAPTLNEPSATQGSVTVSWTAPAGGLTGYKLRLYSADNSPVSDEKTVLKDGEKTLVFDSADNVIALTVYTVKIFAYIDDSGNEIRSSEDSRQVTTVPGITSHNIVSRGTDFITVSWAAPTETEFDNFELKISSSDHAGFTPMEDTVQKNGDYRKTYTDLKPGRTYVISIAMVSRSFRSQSDLTAITKPSQVTSFLATTLDMNRIQLSWTVDTNSKQDKFIINYKDANGVDKVQLVDYIEGESSAQTVIENLLPGYHYTFNIWSRREETNLETVNGESKEVTQNTVPAAVTSLQSSQTQTSVTLSWETDTNTFQDRFRVRYKGTATSTSWSSPEDIQVTKKAYNDGLLPGDKYMIEIWARSGTEDSTKVSITVVLEPIAPTPVWKTEDTSTTALKFIWSYHENIEYHAEGFQLELREKGSTDIVRGPVTVTASTSSHTFQGLTAGQTYTFQISTVTYDDVRSDPKEADGTLADIDDTSPAGITEVEHNNALYIGIGAAVGVIVVIILIVIGVIHFKRRHLSSAGDDNVDKKSNVRDVRQELESAADYNDISLYNELEIPQYEALNTKDKDQNNYDQLQVSTFTRSADATYCNDSEGMYYNETGVANTLPEEGKVEYEVISSK